MKPSNGLRKHDWIVRDCTLAQAKILVEHYHYSGGGSNTRTFAHGLFRKDDPDTPRGVAWWIPPTKSAALSVDENWMQVINLTRLVIEPGAPTNAASFLLGQSMRMIEADGRYKTLLTYADEGQGHTGSIYRATNWIYLGSKMGDPVWINPDTGRHVARKAGPKTRKSSEMIALGYVNTGRTVKHKFIYKFA
jgi:hypothetical protein